MAVSSEETEQQQVQQLQKTEEQHHHTTAQELRQFISKCKESQWGTATSSGKVKSPRNNTNGSSATRWSNKPRSVRRPSEATKEAVEEQLHDLPIASLIREKQQPSETPSILDANRATPNLYEQQPQTKRCKTASATYIKGATTPSLLPSSRQHGNDKPTSSAGRSRVRIFT